MLIGIDGIPLKDIKTGVGHYTFELARSLALASPTDQLEIVSPFSFFPGDHSEDPLDGWPPNLRLTQVKVNVWARNWWTIGLPRYIKRRSLDLFHGTNFDIPLWKRCPAILTIHDLSDLLYPETHEARGVWRGAPPLPFFSPPPPPNASTFPKARPPAVKHLSGFPPKGIAQLAARATAFSTCR